MAQFLDLPEDLVFSVLAFLAPEDLLSIQQACRGLHILGSASHLWHALTFDLPLDIPSVDTLSQPARLLQESTVRALRLHQNWCRNEPRIKRLAHIPNTDIVLQLQFVGHAYIVTLSQAGNLATFLTIWHIEVPLSRVARVEVPHCNRFAASFEEPELVVATLTTDVNNKGSLGLYTIHLTDADDVHEFEEVFCQSLSQPGHVFFDVHVSGPTAAAGLAALGGSIRYSLLLVDIKTRNFRYVDMPSEGMSTIQFKLYRDFVYMVFMVTVAESHSKLVVLQYDLRDMMSGKPPSPISEYEIHKKPYYSTFEYYISNEPTIHGSTTFPLAVRHTSDPNPLGNHAVSVYLVPLAPKFSIRQTIEPTYTFSMTKGRYIEMICLGESGCRVVWLERGWDADEYQFMKAALGPPTTTRTHPFVAPLWPAHVGLPFEPHTCHALYFEECTGRICFSLHTEKLYIMEF